jgi:negative regulator of replication initiation
MSSIQDILKLTPELNQLSKSDTSKKSGVEKGKNKPAQSTAAKDTAFISNDAMNKLNAQEEIKKLAEVVKKAETLTPDQIERLREKIKSDNYLEENAINKIVDKLTTLPNYLTKNSK